MSGTLFIFRGLPASGKSAIASAMIGAGLLDLIVCRDDIRLGFKATGRIDATWTQDTEALVRVARDRLIRDGLASGKRVAVADANLRDGVVRWLRRIADEADCPVIVIEIHVPLELCIERDMNRTGSAHVGEKVIRDMAKGDS